MKNNKLFFFIIFICTVLVIGICAFAILHHRKDNLGDALKFKEEYESYNGLVNEHNNLNYLEVNVNNNNPFVYKTDEEIIDVLKNEDAIIYFGYATCPWCRNIIEPLQKALLDANIDHAYYVDIYDIRDTYVFSKDIEPKQTKKGTDAYYKILELMDTVLEEYYITDDANNKYDTGVKRLYAPTVIAVKDGKITDIHVGTVESQSDPYVGLNDEEKSSLEDIFKKLINSLDTDVCSKDDAC